MKKVVILLSGGLDSAVAAFCARKDIGKTGELYALTFDYGQWHSKEVVCARNIGRELGVLQHQEVKLPISNIVESALLRYGITGVVKDEIGIRIAGIEKEIPSTWVPQRNSVFLALAFAYAETVSADFVYAGFNVRDYSGYPDCRPAFVESIQRALNLASKRYVETGKGIGIITPLMYKTKAKIVELGNELGVPFSLTWSCYSGGEKACGLCDSCRIRLRAFREAGSKDPLKYARILE